LAVSVNNFGGLTPTPEAVTVPPMKLGERVAAARAHAGLTQAALAKRVRITQQTLHKLESGKSEKSAALAEICLETGVSLNWLVRGEGEMLSSQTARPDPAILARAVTVLQHLARLQAGEATFLYDAPALLAIYDEVSRTPSDVELDREAVLRRMAAVLREAGDERRMGRGEVVGAG
jgi:transcriptional regulator with XRE-family HTH domain